jgi:hypothetical protein
VSLDTVIIPVRMTKHVEDCTVSTSALATDFVPDIVTYTIDEKEWAIVSDFCSHRRNVASGAACSYDDDEQKTEGDRDSDHPRPAPRSVRRRVDAVKAARKEVVVEGREGKRRSYRIVRDDYVE